MNSKRPPNDLDNPISESDERALDALLGEMLKLRPSPPDLTQEILTGLSASWELSQVRLNGKAAPSMIRPRRLRGRLIALTAALAASSLFVFFRFDVAGHLKTANHQPQSKPLTIAATKPEKKPSVNAESIAAIPPANKTLPKSDQQELAPTVVAPREGVPLVRKESSTSDATNDATNQPMVVPQFDPVAATENDSTIDLRTALASFDAAMTDYWKRVGVEATAPIDDSQLTTRVKERFGSNLTTVPGELLVDAFLTSEEECREFATKLVNSLFRNTPLADQARERMIDQATVAIVNGHPFDERISAWLTDDSLFVRSQPEQLAQSISTNLLDIDAACAKCHDSPIDGRYAQHDFWSFASVFSPANRPVLFYELPDGRQKASEGHLPTRWLGAPQEKAADAASAAPSLQAFAEAMLDNKAVASALANRVWEIGFGAPLVARSSVLVSPPRDETILKAQQELANVLLRSRFDLRQLARVVASSSAMRRGVSPLLLDDRWVVANEKSLAEVRFAQRTFAAASPSNPKLNRDQLVAAFETRLGGVPRVIDNSTTLLAQPGIEGSGAGQGGKTGNSSPEELAWTNWIADRAVLKESWLHWIKDSSERERHAFYVNGQMDVPSDAMELSKRLMSPNDDEASATNNAIDRLVWLLREGR